MPLSEGVDGMNEEISFNQIIDLFLPRWPFIVICTVIVAVFSFIWSSFMIDPMYRAEGTLYITGNAPNQEVTATETTDLNDLMTSQELARTYGQILSSNTFFKRVAAESGTRYTYEQIQGMTSIASIENTGLLTISVKNTDPKMACALANKILELAPEEISRIVVAGSATMIDPAELPRMPFSPNKVRNAMLGGILGFVFAVALIFLQNLMDKTIKSAEEIRQSFGLPVLGSIPEIKAEGVAGSSPQKNSK